MRLFNNVSGPLVLGVIVVLFSACIANYKPNVWDILLLFWVIKIDWRLWECIEKLDGSQGS